jgi:lysophospholipase L1-like esterase
MNKLALIFGVLCLSLLVGCESGAKRVSGLVTTTPVTQDRDHATYNWQDRHAEILARNQVFKPDVVFIGDSIIHFWGGEPQAPRVWAGAAWTNCFARFKVTNLGYGWDRTENVLWRLDHGELDGIKPKVIIIKIGTNNTSVTNSPGDIAAGIEAICATAHRKVPSAKILLLGILPRHDEKAGHSATVPVNQLLHDRLSDVDYITYCDFDGAFRLPDGHPNPALYRDGVHVNEAGYEILGAKIREQLLALAR